MAAQAVPLLTTSKYTHFLMGRKGEFSNRTGRFSSAPVHVLQDSGTKPCSLTNSLNQGLTFLRLAAIIVAQRSAPSRHSEDKQADMA